MKFTVTKGLDTYHYVTIGKFYFYSKYGIFTVLYASLPQTKSNKINFIYITDT